MALEIQYTRLTEVGARIPLGGATLPVTTSATPGGSQPTTPSPDDTLLLDLRSDVWAAVDIAASPNPTGTATSILIVGPGAPVTVKGRKGLKVAVVGTAAPGGSGSGGVDLTQLNAAIAQKVGPNDLDAARSLPGLWVYPGNGNDNTALTPNQTVFPVKGGYTPGFVRVKIGLREIDAFTANDGQNVVIAGYTFGTGDVVRIEVLRAGLIANAASKARVDTMQGVIDALTATVNALTPDNSGWTAP